MSDPRRILDGPSTTPFERDLLESWTSEQPSPGARARALAIAGAAAGTLAVATAATAAAASTTGAAAGTAAPVTAGAGAGVAVIAKWGALFALVVGSAVGGVLVLSSAHSGDAPPAAAVPTSTLATATMTAMTAPPHPVVAPTPTPPPSEEPTAVSPADLPTAAPAAAPAASPATTGATATTATTAGTTATTSFAEEIASFDRARAALDAGDSDRVIALVETYEKRYPTGTFLQEAEVLRVQALTRKGDSAGARRAGQRFLAAHPTSPHAARIRAILDASAR